MSVAAPAPFDVCGPLPAGTTLLEASAGTGKTFTIAALAARYVAEGHDLSELMLVTFSRAATQELRERVRERLVAAEGALSRPQHARCHPDELIRLLADAPDAEVRLRRQRLTRALAGFDAATIATTHGFCQQMLAGLGMAGDAEPDATFVESVDDLVTEVVDDLYLIRFAHDGDEPSIDLRCARTVAGEAMKDRHAVLVEHDKADDPVAYQRFGMARAVRREVDARKRDRRLLDYDDLLTRLRDALVDPVRGAAATERIRSRYRVVLVDEFQDTDPVQWEILRTAFHGTTTLVLIGDPKQAIYAFRGADLVTYLAAARTAATRHTLARNWRADSDLLTALDLVFSGAALGDSEIVVRPVEATHTARRLTGPPLRLRVVRRPQDGLTRDGLLPVAAARELVGRDVAADIVALLAGRATVAVDGGAPRAVRPSDVAVLVRTNDQAVLVREALDDVGVPAVLTGSRSVFLTPMARQWLVLMHAVEEPHRTGLVRAAALTCFVGWSAQQLANADDTAVDDLALRLRTWRAVLAERGVAALLEVVADSGRLTERLLGAPAGERDLTDLRHIGDTLHAAAVAGQLGSSALTEWLQRRITEADQDAAEDRSRRLESDADAVQCVTVHSSKGLEFPIVYVPFGWDRWANDNPDPLRLHGPDGTRLLDVGGRTGTDYRQRRVLHQEEERGEDLRLLYVAMTRAQCQVVTWWAPSSNTPASALHRLLFGAFGPGEQPPKTVPVPHDVDVRRLLAERVGSSGVIAVEQVGEVGGACWEPDTGPPPVLEAAVFDRPLDAAWRRTSYTGLTFAVHDAAVRDPGVGSEPEEEERQDEVTGAAAAEAAPTPTAVEEPLRAVPSPLADLPTGAAFGTLVHQVLETVHTGTDDLATELRVRCTETVRARLAESVDPAELATGLLPVLETPLGPLAGDLRLRDIDPSDRLTEVDFELPLAGGDRPRAADSTLSAMADLLRRYLPPTDPLSGYPDALAVPGLAQQRLRGYLTGSLDAVLRVRDAAGEPRYLVVDYKTNWLGDFGSGSTQPLTAWHYRPAALTDAMVHAHYPLQALLYFVALHRFLRWRQPAYDPDRHLGGCLYLFLRGMCGPATPRVDGVPTGVFGWRPPGGLVEDLSLLLDGTVP